MALDLALRQFLLASGWYIALLLVVRIGGRRLGGQTATLDLLVLITISVQLQNSMLLEGPVAAAVFGVTALFWHRLLASGCARWQWLRIMVRGRAQVLIRDGHIEYPALRAERLSKEDLIAGLRKLGISDPQSVVLATLEETGQISAITRSAAS
jgi:uncharacterized membrane protein YcaP (DUF421 family)